MFEYAVLTTLYWVAFYGLYALVLRRNTFFQLNRWYLLGALAAGMVLPLLKDINLHWGVKEEPIFYAAPVVEGFEFIYNLEAAVITPAPAAFPWKTVLAAVYLLGGGLCLIRFLAGLYRLWRLQAESEMKYVEGSRVAYTSEAHLPFSFGRTIFLSKKTPWTPEEEADIISHERAHIRDGHTMDVLALELLGVAFWFSPLLYLYRRALRLQHEYIADAIVLRTRARSDYGRLLIRQVLPGLHPYIAHSFHSSLKQRISMMTKTQSKPVARWLYLAAAPLAFGLVLLFSQRSAIAASLPELSTLLTFAGNEEKSLPAEAHAKIFIAAPAISGSDPDAPPIFEGCGNEPVELQQQCSEKKLVKYLHGGKMTYPDEARKKGIQGTVVVQFVVDATGKVSNAEVRKGIGGGCDEEVLRVVREMPRWTPGVKDGRKVDVSFFLPVQFVNLDAEVSNGGSLEEWSFSGGIPLQKYTIQYSDAMPIWFHDGKRLTSKEAQELQKSGNAGDILEIRSPEHVNFLVGEEAKNVTVLIILPKEEKEGQRDKTVYYVNGKPVNQQEALILLKSRSEQIKHIEVLTGEKAISLAGEKGKNGVTSITLYAPGEE